MHTSNNQSFRSIVTTCLLVLLTSCADDGNNGMPGYNSLVNILTIAAEEPCLSGGKLIQTGIDDNRDGILDLEEIDSEEAVCNGTDGTDGTDGTSVTLIEEPAGSNCLEGGYRIVQEGENDRYICNGTSSTADTILYVDIQDENCSDASPGTLLVPNCQIQGAINNAESGNRIYVAAGFYQPIIIFKDVYIYGNFDSSDWSRNTELHDYDSVISDAYGFARPYAVLSYPGIDIRIDGFDIRKEVDTTSTHYGLFLQSSSIVANNRIVVSTTSGSSHAYGIQIYSANNGIFTTGYNNKIFVEGSETSQNNAALYDASDMSVWYNNIFEVEAGDGSPRAVFTTTSISTTYAHNTLLTGSTSELGVEEIYGFARGGAAGITYINNNITMGDGLQEIGIQANGSDILIHNNIYSTDTPVIESNAAFYSTDDSNGCSGWITGCNAANIGNMSADPEFTLTPISIYALQETSLLIDAGVDAPSYNTTQIDISNVSMDIDNIPRDALPDIGAHEYVAP